MSIKFCSLDEAYKSYSMNDYTGHNNDNYYINYDNDNTQLSYTKNKQEEKNINHEYNNCDKIKTHIEECFECRKLLFQQYIKEHNKQDNKEENNNIIIILLIILFLWLIFSKK